MLLPTAAAYAAVLRRSTHKKKKVLVLSSRGVTSSNIELVEDLLKLLPHAKKDAKFDKGNALSTLVEIAELSDCALCLYFEARKRKDLYMWCGSIQDTGPSVKFLVQQVRPMSDPRLTGNCLLGSRPILSFDASFNDSATHRVFKGLLSTAFAAPKGHPRSKPFQDHVISFSCILGGRIVVRHYQVVPPSDKEKHEEASLVEIGPRFVLVPVRVLEGCFTGKTLYASAGYVSPNETRSDLKRKRSKTTVGHVAQKERRRERIGVEGVDQMADDPFDDTFVDSDECFDGNE
jgi:ribosome biogenesis protein BRX1